MLEIILKKVLKPILVFSSTIVVERNSVQAGFLNFFKKQTCSLSSILFYKIEAAFPEFVTHNLSIFSQ